MRTSSCTQCQDQSLDIIEAMEIKSSIRKSNRDHQKHQAETSNTSVEAIYRPRKKERHLLMIICSPS